MVQIHSLLYGHWSKYHLLKIPLFPHWMVLAPLLKDSWHRNGILILDYQFFFINLSVQLLSSVWLFVTPWTAACQASLSITKSQSLLKLMSIESVMPSNHFILYRPLLLLPSIFPSIRVFPNESILLLINLYVYIYTINIVSSLISMYMFIPGPHCLD